MPVSGVLSFSAPFFNGVEIFAHLSFVFNLSCSVNKALRLKYLDLTRDAFATNAVKLVNFPIFQEGSADEASHCQRRGSSVLLIQLFKQQQHLYCQFQLSYCSADFSGGLSRCPPELMKNNFTSNANSLPCKKKFLSSWMNFVMLLIIV